VGRLTRDEALAGAFDFEEREVDLPQLGGSVLIRRLSMAQDMRTAVTHIDGTQNFTGTLVRRIASSLLEPKMGIKEVEQWMSRYPLEAFQPLIDAMNELSSNGAGEVADEAETDFRPS
jgi:hypothetical protein